jgi:hypothetical protein
MAAVKPKSELRLATLIMTMTIEELKAELETIEDELRRRGALTEKGRRDPYRVE